ncbi:cold-responsive protein kinase 1 [Cocos nucifera]|uniref:Cold-responsive protein kinase 1 n=1 Tax=Cocos nucifera TaxID=13894 RepID=A0A8K0IQG9_COCNU|nr:cold-responsive protein kinase 1 [Cocos nucifera]
MPTRDGVSVHLLGFSSPGSTGKALSFLFISSVVILVIMGLLVLFWKCIKPKILSLKMVKSTKNGPEFPDYFSGNLRTISYFDYRTLKRATRDFDTKNQLGRGGFGQVYKGKLVDGRMIAVKQLSLGNSQQGESEFLAEVRMLTSIQHKNLVHLIGCCFEGAERLLVYEYMKNGSLDSIIYENSETFLDWKIRFQIILGIARGLQYLHEDSNIRIVHRDIKASNILLDDKFQPRISDFGLARFFPEDQLYLSTAIAGTLGYTAPEYAIRGELTEKADIYSFGVLALEIISSRKNTDLSLPTEMQYLPGYAWKLFERSRVIDLVDPKLRTDGIVEKDVLQVCNVAFLCLQPHPSLRPPMSEIVAMLTCKIEPMATHVKPAILERKHRIDISLSLEPPSEVLSSPPQSNSTFSPLPNRFSPPCDAFRR